MIKFDEKEIVEKTIIFFQHQELTVSQSIDILTKIKDEILQKCKVTVSQ